MNDGHPADGNEGIFSGLRKIFGGKGKKDEDVTEEEIMDMVNEGHEHGVLKENEAEMINNIFEFGEKQAQDVMIHRKSIVAIDCNATVSDTFEFILNESFSRYPVYDGDIDNIMGILHIRDLLKTYVDESNRDKKLVDVKEQVMFDAYCIPETRNISLLFKEMQSKKVHIAVVVDEYGQTAGIVTLEDILEEIVGNILDEYDDEEEIINKQADGSYIIDGHAVLDDLEDMFEVSFDCDDIDTINGYLIYKMGRIPDENTDFYTDCCGYRFTVMSVNNKMIDRVKVEKLPEDIIEEADNIKEEE